MSAKTVETLQCDIAVIGGGLAGTLAGISAARMGMKTILIQNRPVLGGNSSSEVRVPLGGASDFNPWARESGILEEFFLAERRMDARRVWIGEIPSIWDMTLYDIAYRQENLTVLLETQANEVVMKDDATIERIRAFNLSNETSYEIVAERFVDATGDGTIAYLSGAEYRFGREAKSEFGEELAPDEADDLVMGSSLLFHAEDAGGPVPFYPPSWAHTYETNEDLLHRPHDDIVAGYWWIEVGNPPYHTIDDNEKIRHELLSHLYGVWDHIKNKDDHGAENLHIDFIGAVPGKRESRRIVGDYIMHEQDIRFDSGFEDAVAYGGWFCDLHAMGGILNMEDIPEPSFNSDLSEVDRRQMYTYSIPFRSLYSKNIDNLLMAGRNISATHVAFGSTRLMATCAVIGQAVGTAAALSVRKGVTPRQLGKTAIAEVQQQLLKDDCYIPSIANADERDHARTATVTVSSTATLSFPKGIVGEEYEHAKQKAYPRSTLETERAQLFPASSGRLDSVELKLRSESAKDVEATLHVWKTNSIIGFASRELLTEQKLTIPAGFNGLLTANLGIDVGEPTLLIVSIVAREEVLWMYSSNPPTGTVSASRIIENWKPQKGSYEMVIHPDSKPYEAQNLLSGVSRPEKWTNIWVSDDRQPLPAWVEYELKEASYIDTVHLTFDTNINLAHMAVPGLYVAPTCARDYTISAEDEAGVWHDLISEEGNFQRKRVHTIERGRYRRVKLTVSATNGDPSARLYEMRLYDERGK